MQECCLQKCPVSLEINNTTNNSRSYLFPFAIHVTVVGKDFFNQSRMRSPSGLQTPTPFKLHTTLQLLQPCNAQSSLEKLLVLLLFMLLSFLSFSHHQSQQNFCSLSFKILNGTNTNHTYILKYYSHECTFKR